MTTPRVTWTSVPSQKSSVSQMVPRTVAAGIAALGHESAVSARVQEPQHATGQLGARRAGGGRRRAFAQRTAGELDPRHRIGPRLAHHERAGIELGVLHPAGAAAADAGADAERRSTRP